MNVSATTPDVVVDARGVLCPVPIIRLARTARDCADGTVVALLTDDPAAAHDVPAWCRLRGHELLGASVAADADAFPTEPEARRPTAAGPEPDVPNTGPGQSLRHLIRLSKPAP